jgi:hypothetical protein
MYLGQHGENTFEAWYEHIQKIKIQKIQSPLTPPVQRRKNWGSWVHATSPHWLNRISIPNYVCYPFLLRLTPFVFGDYLLQSNSGKSLHVIKWHFSEIEPVGVLSKLRFPGSAFQCWTHVEWVSSDTHWCPRLASHSMIFRSQW